MKKYAWQIASHLFIIVLDVQAGGQDRTTTVFSNVQILTIKSCLGARQARAMSRPAAQARERT
jgi:hypothetical protein